MLRLVRARAMELGVRAVVMTFEPHTRAVVRPDAPLHLLTQLPEKLAQFAALEAEVAILEAEIVDLEDQVAAAKADALSLEAQVSNLEAVVAERDATIAGLQMDVGARDATIAELRDRLAQVHALSAP